VLDPAGIPISTAVSSQWVPAVAFDGTNLLVVWQDDRGGDYSDIYGARVTPSGALLDSSGIAVSTAAGRQDVPAVAFEGANFLVVWQDERSGCYSDIYGARVTSSGAVYDEGAVVTQEGNQTEPALCRGTGSQMFLVYQGWAGTVGGKTYNTDRIWGKMNPAPGTEETMNEERGTPNVGPTIVRGVLRLPVSPFSTHTTLFDVTGRKVMSLVPGPNDVMSLALGVYFVREQSAFSSQHSGASNVHKVVIAR
jgi:hypothetical protein